VAANDLSTVVTETDALYLTPKQPHQLALFTQVDEVIQARLSSMATGLRYDAFYMTRKQKERMKDGASGSYPSIGADFLREQRFQDTVVMHPLPRVDELSPEVDKDRRGIYFKQAAYGVPVRMALLKFLFERREKPASARKRQSVIYESPEAIGPQCRNPTCVTLNEPVSTRRRFQILSPDEGGAWVVACLYCDHRHKVQYLGNAKSKRYSSFDPSLVTTLREWLKADELAIFDTIKEAEELGYEPIKSGPQRILLNESEINQALVDIAGQILRDCQDPDRLLILGVRSVGAQLAQRVAQQLEKQRGRRPELGEIELFGAGEELRRASLADPDAGPLNLKDREVILVDDVLYTGRTVKSALSIIFRSARPKSVRLAVLIDRGHREVPVRPNYVGKNIPTAENERVRVRLRGLDHENRDQVVLYSIDHAVGTAASLPAGEGAVASR